MSKPKGGFIPVEQFLADEPPQHNGRCATCDLDPRIVAGIAELRERKHGIAVIMRWLRRNGVTVTAGSVKYHYTNGHHEAPRKS